jgi:hypothetical protein
MHEVKTFTIVTKSYLAYAKALAFKVNQFHPGASFTIFVVDPEGMGDAATGAKADIRSAADLFEEDTFRLMTGYYTADELCNACKPWAHQALLSESSVRTTIYLDSDIYVTGSLNPLVDDLGGKSILLTPHLLKPSIENMNEDLERALLNGGIYNGGCLVLNDSETTQEFLSWWKQRLRFSCLRFEPGLCVDQSWLNFVPALFGPDEVVICRRLGVNVGHWNMQERLLTSNARGDYFADNEPVSFLHFSGWEPERPEVPSKYAVTSPGESAMTWEVAGRAYKKTLLENGLGQNHDKQYSYSVGRDGTPITLEMRRALLARARMACEKDLVDEFFSSPSSFLASGSSARGVNPLKGLIRRLLLHSTIPRRSIAS